MTGYTIVNKTIAGWFEEIMFIFAHFTFFEVDTANDISAFSRFYILRRNLFDDNVLSIPTISSSTFITP